MQPRALKNLVQLPPSRRLDAIAEGLELLVEHVAALTDDLLYLGQAGRRRGVPMLQTQSQEEAAKVLILLDLVRLGWGDHERVMAQIRCFYSHLSRCIYAELSQMSPADFAEVRRLVRGMRPSHYLDGPGEVDWIYRNELLDSRESGLYVDYVQHEDDAEWVTPARYAGLAFGPDTAVQHLVAALHRLGATSRPGLDIIAKEWTGQVIEDDTHWTSVAALNKRVVTQLTEANLVLPDATTDDARLVIDRWTFPLHSLDLDEVRVPLKELQARRDEHLASLAWW